VSFTFLLHSKVENYHFTIFLLITVIPVELSNIMRVTGKKMRVKEEIIFCKPDKPQ